MSAITRGIPVPSPNISSFSYSGAVVTYTVTTTGLYAITAIGGSGGNGYDSVGGFAADVVGDIQLTAGEILDIAVAGAGADVSQLEGTGGGGSFVVEAGSTGSLTPLVIAGGGGGGSAYSLGANGGNAGGIVSSGGAGGAAGRDDGPRANEYGGGGGGGLQNDGGSGAEGAGGASFAGGAAGGPGKGGVGGFGGGGGNGYGSGGGGGGYSGGVGGDAPSLLTPNLGAGSGGTSFDSGMNQTFALAAGPGNGLVTITPLPAVNLPSTITGTQARQATTDEAAISPFVAVAIADPNPGTQTETVTVSPSPSANGTLSDPNAATDGSSSSGGAIILTGSAAAVTTAIDRLVFMPASGQMAPGQAQTTGFSISDTNSAGQTTLSSNTSVIDSVAPATINGTVFLDQNVDGVDDGTDTGLAGQTVNLLNSSGQTIAATSANSSGQYSFINVAAGSDTVQFISPPGDQFSTPSSVPVTLTAGATVIANAGVYAPATISVLTYLDTNRDGTQDNGEAGLSGVSVELGSGLGVQATTNAAGAASFTGLVPGNFEVAISTPGGDTVTQQVNVGAQITLVSGASAQVTEGFAPSLVPPTLVASQTSLPTQSDKPLDPFASVTVTDGNAGATDTVAVSVTGQGGTLSGTGVAAVTGGYTITGSSSTISALVEAASFTPTAGLPGTSGVTTFSLTDTSSLDPTTTPAVSIKLTDVDPAVAISASDATSTVATTDEKAANPFTSVSITDPNANQSETATVSLNAANGSLSDSVGGSVSSGVYSVSGSVSAVAADLDALVFTPTTHKAGPGTLVSTTVTAAISDTAGEKTSLATTVNATAVNDPPTINGTQAGQTTTDYVALKPFSGVAVTDPDVGVQDSLTITLTGDNSATMGAGAGKAIGTDANGTLSGAGLSKTGTGTYTLAAATPASLSAAVDALTFTPAQGEVAAGQSVTTRFALAASQNGAATTDSSTTVIATALNYVNGSAGGWAVLKGTAGVDVITAHGKYNAIFGNGGADIINAGDGGAYVDVAGGNATVTLGGGVNAVVGGDGSVTVKGTPDGYTGVTLGNGNNTVQIGGQHDVVLLGNGTNLVGGTQGMAFITTGSGNDTIKLGGSGSTVNAGAGTNSITGGTGQDSFVMPKAGQGFDGITGFTEANGDVLDLRAALGATGWNHQAATLGNYLKVTDSGGSATLLVAASGSGGGVAVATLNGSGNLALADLLSHHSLLTS